MLGLSKMRCSYCHQLAMSWLQLSVGVAFAATAVFYLLNII